VDAYAVTVKITPREGLLDPEGKAIGGALRSLGFEGVGAVRVGRLVHLRLNAADPADARQTAEEMCRRLLANPVTEDYAIEVANAAGKSPASAPPR
jgi:phosphoribosylformylglycinamidine synthase subunit PurS